MSSALTAARMSYAAAVVGFLTYGIYVVLASICIYFLLQHRQYTKGRYVLIIYTCAMFVVSSTYFCAAAKWSEIEFVESNVNPAAFASSLSSKLSLTKRAASVVNIWMADSLMIYRTYVIWGGNPYILVLPMIMFIGTIGSSIALLAETAKPGAMLGIKVISDLGTAFWSMSISLNVISTLLIAGQLLWHQRELRRAGIPHGDNYTNIVAVLAESAALYSICGLIYIPLFARNLTLQYPFSALFLSAASIAPILIVIRMALGVAAKDSRSGTSTNMDIASIDSKFSKPPESSNIISRRSHRRTATTVVPARQGFTSVQTLADDGLDYYPMDVYKRTEAV